MFISQLNIKKIGLEIGGALLQKLSSIDENPLRIYLQYTIFVFTTDPACQMGRSNPAKIEIDINSLVLNLGRP